MTGAKLVQYTELHQIVYGVVVEPSLGEADSRKVLALMQEYKISARLTFSNSLLREEHLQDQKCNALCALFEENKGVQNGVIIHSDLLLDYLQKII